MFAESYKPVGPPTVSPQTDSNVLISRCSESPGFFNRPPLPGQTKCPLDGLSSFRSGIVWQLIETAGGRDQDGNIFSKESNNRKKTKKVCASD